MEEVWRDIKGYAGRYQVSNLGHVRSLKFGNTIGKVKNLKPILNSCGYYVISLKGKQSFIHRIVAEAFIPNPLQLPVVDHINTISTDNRCCNLQWTTIKGNVNNPISARKRINTIRRLLKGRFGVDSMTHKKVYQYTLNGEFIKEWACMSDAWRFYKIDSGSMTRACQGKSSSAGGFIWRYEKVDVQPLKPRKRKVLQYDLDGNFIKEWDTISDAARTYKTSTGRICSCLCGNTKKCKGFVWKYK